MNDPHQGPEGLGSNDWGAEALRPLPGVKGGGAPLRIRVVARVETSAGEELSAALLAANLARPYRGGKRRSWCDRADGD